MEYHNPVLLKESVEALSIRPNGVYVDVTFGGGGHTAHILEHLGPEGKLFAFDQDPDARRNIIDDSKLTFIPSNFRHLKRQLRLHGIRKIDGILADLGVSSFQFDEAERGFSFRFDAELDMRMNQNADLSAGKVINQYEEAELVRIFSEYGEIRNSKTLAKAIIADRDIHAIETTSRFLDTLGPVIRGKRNKYLAQVFQAIRIEVNDEMNALKEMLSQGLEILDEGGRFVVISYHSLEDRLAKNFFRSGNFEGKQIKDFFGNIERPFHLITRKAIEASQKEIEENPRARSAKLRVAEKKEKNGQKD